jgi:hypothetical protein
MTGMEYHESDGIFKVFVKINFNDFVMDFRNSLDDDINFESSGSIDTNVIFVRKYLDNKIQLFADEKKPEGMLANIEASEDELRMDILFRCGKDCKKFLIKNQILADLYDDQTNLVIFKYRDI